MTIGPPLAWGRFQHPLYALPWSVVSSDGLRLQSAMRRHLDLVWRVLRRVGLSPQDADEAAQDVFWVLARRLGDVPVRAEKSFLISTAIRMASDQRRRLATRSAEELPVEIPSGELAHDEAVALHHTRALLDEALDTLTPVQRTVFVLVEGWDLYTETLAYQIFNDFGITAPRTSYAVLTVNGESLGIYRVVEVVDGRFTDNHFPDHDGNLYKTAPGAPAARE